YYRIAVFPIRVPPVRERREDIPVLASRFLIGAAERHHKQFPGFDEAATRLLASFSWPGNVRELQNEIERAAALARDGETIGANRLSAVLHSATSQPPAPVRVPASVSESQMSPAGNHGSLVEVDGDRSLREARAAFEARYIGEILRECAGNLSRAAKKMGVSRVQLQRKVKEYGLR
ncbi:MAG: helix-turn-helix domain-containing protein, partial [Stellaceae bacterium]